MVKEIKLDMQLGRLWRKIERKKTEGPNKAEEKIDFRHISDKNFQDVVTNCQPDTEEKQ